MKKTEQITLHKIRDGQGNMRVLKKPLIIKLTLDHDVWTADADPIYGGVRGRSKLEIIRSVSQDMFFLYREYGLEKDEKLTPGAQELKRRILEYL